MKTDAVTGKRQMRGGVGLEGQEMGGMLMVGCQEQRSRGQSHA